MLGTSVLYVIITFFPTEKVQFSTGELALRAKLLKSSKCILKTLKKGRERSSFRDRGSICSLNNNILVWQEVNRLAYPEERKARE